MLAMSNFHKKKLSLDDVFLQSDDNYFMGTIVGVLSSFLDTAFTKTNVDVFINAIINGNIYIIKKS